MLDHLSDSRGWELEDRHAEDQPCTQLLLLAATHNRGSCRPGSTCHPLHLLPVASPVSSGPSVLASPGQQHQSLCWSRLSTSEAMVALCSNPTGPDSLELPQPWVQRELEQGQHVSASTEGQGRRRPEETKAEQPSSSGSEPAWWGRLAWPGDGAPSWSRSPG